MGQTAKRSELYRLLWTEPTTRVASKYGISDVGLAKVCQKHENPPTAAPILGATTARAVASLFGFDRGAASGRAAVAAARAHLDGHLNAVAGDPGCF